MTERELHELLNKIEPADAGAMDAAKKRFFLKFLR